MLPRDYIFLGIRIGGVLLVISTIAYAPSVIVMGSLTAGSEVGLLTAIVAVAIAFLIAALLIWRTDSIVDRLFNRITNGGEYYGDEEDFYDEDVDLGGEQDDAVVDESPETVTGSDATENAETASRLRMEQVQAVVLSILGMWLLVDSLPQAVVVSVNIVSSYITGYYGESFVFRSGNILWGLLQQFLPVILGCILFFNGSGIVETWRRVRTPRITA